MTCYTVFPLIWGVRVSRNTHSAYFSGGHDNEMRSLRFIGNQGVYGSYGGNGGEAFASERPGKQIYGWTLRGMYQ